MADLTNTELADWLLAVKQRLVPGRTGGDWVARFKFDLIAARLKASDQQGQRPAQAQAEGDTDGKR